MDYFDQLETRLAELTTSGAHLRRHRGFNLRWPRSPLPALALGLSILVVAAVAALALSARNSRPAPRPATQPAAAPISPALVRNYRLLRRPVRPSDALPAVFARTGRGYGLAPGLARRVIIPSTRVEMWLEPGRTGFCIYVAERPPAGPIRTSPIASSCADAGPLVEVVSGAATLALKAPALRFSTNEPDLAVGIVPDDVTSLVLTPAHGRPLQIRPTEGFFAVPYGSNDRLYWIERGQTRQALRPPSQRSPMSIALTPVVTILSSTLPNGSHFKLMIQRVRFRLGVSTCLSYTQQFGRGSSNSASCVEPSRLRPLPEVLAGPAVCGPHPAQVVWGIAPPGARVELRSGGRAEGVVRVKLKLASRIGLRGDIFYVIARRFPDTLVALTPSGRVERAYPLSRRPVPLGCK